MNIPKLLSIFLLFSSFIQPYDYNSKINVLRKIDRFFNNKINFSLMCGIMSGLAYKEFAARKNSVDMPEVLANWCKATLKSHGITNVDLINFKIFKEGDIRSFWAAAGTNYITLDSFLVDSLINALETSKEKESKEFLYVHEFFLLHEIHHLKSYDFFKRVIGWPSILILHSQLINHFANPILDKIANKNFRQAILSLSIFFGKNFIINHLSNSAQVFYTRYQESQADNFAISKINKVDQINAIINFMEKLHADLIDIIKYPNKLIKANNINFVVKGNFRDKYKLANKIYKMKRSKDNFADWLEKNPFWLRLIHESYDPTHPMPKDRIIALEKRKQELSAQKTK